ncbi:MAG: penicillin acylase family protein [Bacteroidetes bacterium]|nr:penicillin acylase family protein [Bacteroidota bacterium]
MKIVFKIIAGLLLLIVCLVAGVYVYLSFQKPVYTGVLKLKGLKKQTEVFFDDYGIPHIYGQNEEDVYFALGYVHAQDRLFQMEMMRRVSAGRLSEILGSSMIGPDKFFRMLGFNEHARLSEEKFFKNADEPFQKEARSYLAGINSYIEHGKTPLEFRLIGITKERFTVKDMFLVADYMSFVFQMAFRTDPLMSRLEKKYGKKYLDDLALGYVPGTLKEPVHPNDSIKKPATAVRENSASFESIYRSLPLPVWLGSNGWVLSPKKSQSGKVLFANDTHIGFGQPAVWYEAYLECPGFSFYGNYMAGFPFAPIGHTPGLAWGLTIFENDDLDFFKEQTDSLHPEQVWFKDHWEKLESRMEVIKVKDTADIHFNVRQSHHGPICSDAMNDFKEVTGDPVSASWTFLKFPCNLFQVTYQLDHSKNIDDVRTAASQISAPGLNIVYGDAEGNIAWWTAAKLVKRPPHVNPGLLLDGSSGNDEWMGWYDFKDNPQSENPPEGFVYSANNQPDTTAGILYPGYYVPEDRAVRITQVLGEDKIFSKQDMELLHNDVISPAEAGVAKVILDILGNDEKNKTATHTKVSEILSSWNGDHRVDNVAPTIYYKLLYHILNNAMGDEFGDKDFDQFLFTHVMKNTVAPFIKNENSVWWDDVRTKDATENRKQIVEKSFDQTIAELEVQLGADPAKWKWGKVHLLEHAHAIGSKKPLDKIFNIGPFPAPGGNETVNQQGFELNGKGIYKVRFGPALRRVIDFADPLNGTSILPTGQSGNVVSRHYSDQAEMYIKGETRKEMMDRKEIEQKCKDKLTLQPGY